MKYLDPALRDTVDDLYDNAPCGYLATWPDGKIAGVNATLLNWLESTREDLLDKQFGDLLTAGGRIHYETHFAPLLFSVGEFDSVALDLVSSTGERLPMFVTGNVRRNEDGEPVLVRITAIDARERRAYERELVEERRRAEREHERAQVLVSTLQRSLLPPKLLPPHGLDADAYYHTASWDDVGGDFYDMFPLSEDSWGFFLGDVCGKGSDAAVVTSLTRYTLRAAAVYDSDPVKVLHNLDTVLNQELDQADARFCTVIYGTLSRRDGGFDVQLASGGHPPALLLKADGSVRYVETPGGQLVGILPNARFVATECRLEPGDTFVLYTDGLTEARTGRGRERYDDHGALLEFARRHAPNTPSGIVADLKTLMESFDSGLEDDAAVMAFGMPVQEPDSSTP
ncbi:PAS domain-containing protein [Rhodococcus sp. Eu-32]|uniref:SpoIIE family protein phosphatase n=1 Tax=Rhodococcus sp. Eu-32 TaxID=1017319 RepID=UPI000DF45324|nr:SpoIIE family protein phosphatase [Rhodococcus sp. Eu-32]RRQ26562.1 PAS domain-containing protein [Rhodococcus sp. Eu-32]